MIFDNQNKNIVNVFYLNVWLKSFECINMSEFKSFYEKDYTYCISYL